MGRDLGRARVLHGRSAIGQGPLLHRDPAAERDRTPARRSRPRPHAGGHADPPCPDAGLRGALGSRDGSRRHRHPGRRRTEAPRGGRRTPRPRSRGVRRAGLGLEGAVRRRDRRADQADGRLARLDARTVHDGRGPLACGARRVRAAVRGRPDLPRRAARELVPDRPHRPERLRGRARRGRRRARHLPVSALGRLEARSRSRPRASRRCSATPASRCTPATSGTRPSSGRRSPTPSTGARSRSWPTTTSTGSSAPEP